MGDARLHNGMCIREAAPAPSTTRTQGDATSDPANDEKSPLATPDSPAPRNRRHRHGTIPVLLTDLDHAVQIYGIHRDLDVLEFMKIMEKRGHALSESKATDLKQDAIATVSARTRRRLARIQ